MPFEITSEYEAWRTTVAGRRTSTNRTGEIQIRRETEYDIHYHELELHRNCNLPGQFVSLLWERSMCMELSELLS